MNAVQVDHEPSAQRFVIWVDGDVAGHAAYRRQEGRWVFTHTEIDDAHDGEGLGSQLARAALDHVRANGGQVVARCPFIKGWIDRHHDYADLVAVPEDDATT